MPYITKKDLQPFRNWYATHICYVDDVSHIFGVANHEIFYRQLESWCAFIDSVFPDWFPLGDIQNILISIVKFVYDNNANHSYNVGVDSGIAIIGKVTDAINWAQNQITSSVNDMRNKIDTEIIAPVRQKAAQIEQSLKDAQAKLSDMGINIDGFQSNIDTMKSNISSFDSSIKAFDNKLFSFDSKLKGLDSTANGLQSQLRDAQAKLNEYKNLIDNVTKRVDNLEGKQAGVLDFLKNLGA
jgi:uncharacterized phage infection (PIP) family protein YhgE